MAKTTSALDRFWSKVIKRPSGCWEWHTATQRGYGHFWADGSSHPAHRWIYEQTVDPSLEPDLVIDHLCRNRRCVRPDHLEKVSDRENILRGVGQGAVNFRKVECAQGHPLDDDNTHTRPNGRRRCRTCMRNEARARRARQGATGA